MRSWGATVLQREENSSNRLRGETLTLIAADSWEEGRVREREEHGNKVNRGWKRIQCRLGWRESSGSGVRVRQTGSSPLSFLGRPTCRQRLISGCGDHTQTSQHFFYSHSPVCYCLFHTAYIHWTVHQSGAVGGRSCKSLFSRNMFSVFIVEPIRQKSNYDLCVPVCLQLSAFMLYPF